jgi:hypothetical protein
MSKILLRHTLTKKNNEAVLYRQWLLINGCSVKIAVFTVFRLLTDFVCLYNYEFWLSLCKSVRSSVILLLPLFLRVHWFPTVTINWSIGEKFLSNATFNDKHKDIHNRVCSCKTQFRWINLCFDKWKHITVRWFSLNRNESGRFGALKSDSTHHFFRNACTKL